jgi:multidrug efflux pump subunit AcrA (membrane-fusion protein)
MRHLSLQLASACLLAGILGCARAPAPPNAAPAAAPPPAPVSIKPERKTLHRAIGQPGQIDAFQQTPLYAKIAGYVKEFRVDIGDRVMKDQVLAVLSVPEVDEELAQKVAAVKQTEAEVEQSQKAFEAAKAHHETTQALVQEARAGRSRAAALVKRWKSEVDRLDSVVQGRVLDRQTLEETRYQYEAAKATQEEVEAKVRSAEATEKESAAQRDKAQADIGAAQARLQVAQADQRRVQALADYAQIKAPFEGTISFKRYIDVGHFIQPPASAAARGEPLYVVMQSDTLRVFVDVPESDAVWISDGLKAGLRAAAMPGREFDGKVARNGFALDPKTRTLRTEIDIANPKAELRPGMYAYATIHVEHANAWVLPATAVVVQGDQAYCYRVESGKAVKTPVQVGLRDGGLVEVLKKQAKEKWEDISGAEEIVSNATGTSDGQKINGASGR